MRATRKKTMSTNYKLLLLVSLLSLASCFHLASCDEPQTGGLFSRFMTPFQDSINKARGLLGGSGLSGEQKASWQQRLGHLQGETFKMFARIYNKTYSADEFPRRMRLFFERRQEIEASVRAYAEGRLPFMMRENAYADWDESEVKKLMGVAPPRTLAELLPEERQAMEIRTPASPARSAARRFPRSILADNDIDLGGPYGGAGPSSKKGLRVGAAVRLPASKDWRTSDCISAPINQMRCGACYAIATMSVIETMRCLRSQTAPILSPQHIVDCATPRAGYENYGCEGGWPTRVLRYLQDTGLAVRDACYPFVRRQQYCKLSQLTRSSPACIVNASPTDSRLNYKVLNNEHDILYHVAKTGPVVTVMRATDRFLYYGSGIFDDPSCSRRRDDVDHAIVIVGYGRENGQDYWLIKNSWGTREWGQMGYGKYRRGTNACSIGYWGWVITA